MHCELNLVKAPGRGAAVVGAGIFTQVRRISMVGVPSSAASYAAGQDLAPAALRSAGLPGQLMGSGLEVHDDGDLPHQVWSPDRDHPLAQNAGQATGASLPRRHCEHQQALPDGVEARFASFVTGPTACRCSRISDLPHRGCAEGSGLSAVRAGWRAHDLRPRTDILCIGTTDLKAPPQAARRARP